MKSFLHGEAAILMGIVTWAGRLKRTEHAVAGPFLIYGEGSFNFGIASFV